MGRFHRGPRERYVCKVLLGYLGGLLFCHQPADYDAFVFHQANAFIIKQLMRKLKLKKEDVPISLDRYGNTGGISIPLTICDAFSADNEKKHVLMAGFGIGLSWGVTSLTIDMNKVYPITETVDYYREGKITPEML